MEPVTPETPTPSQGRPKPGGRPRDAHLSQRLTDATTELLADRGPAGFTVDDLAARGACGKASIYRRWRTLDDIVADTVRDLGVREHDVSWPDPGSIRGDLIALLAAATTGTRARAELALLSLLPYRPTLRQAYTDGPLLRLAVAFDRFYQRATKRGENIADAPGIPEMQAAIAWLNTTSAHTGQQLDHTIIAAAVDVLLLPRPGERTSGPPYPPLAPTEDEWQAHLDTLKPRAPGR